MAGLTNNELRRHYQQLKEQAPSVYQEFVARKKKQIDEKLRDLREQYLQAHTDKERFSITNKALAVKKELALYD